jgi:hypothetical protein
MKYIKHPDRDAAFRCSQCNKSLCAGCATAEEKTRFVCTRCMTLKAAQDIVHGTQKRLGKRKKERQIRGGKKKRSPQAYTGSRPFLSLVSFFRYVTFCP